MSRARPHIIRTDAVVLRALDYGETSRIVTLFTRQRGKIGVMARGARATKSRFGATLEPMAYIQAVVHFRPGRELQTLSEASHLQVFPRLSSRLDRIEPGVRAIELVSALMQAEETNPEMLNLLIDMLRVLDGSDDGIANVLPYFTMGAASLLGFGPMFEREDVAGLRQEHGWLHLESGAITADRGEGGDRIRATRAALRAFAVFVRAEIDVVLRMQMTPEVRLEVRDLVESYLRYHVEDAFPERSARVFGRLHPT